MSRGKYFSVPSLRALGKWWLVVVCCFTASHVARAQQLHLSDKIAAPTKLRFLNQREWLFDNKLAVTHDAIVRWGTWPGILKQQATWLADGSWIVGEFQIQHEGAVLSVESDWLEIPTIDMISVRALVLAPPPSRSKWSDLQQRMAAVEGGQDVVWLMNEQRVAGVVRWRNKTASNWADRLVLDSGNQQTEIMLADVQAIVFSPALLGPLPEVVGPEIGLKDGTLLRGCELAYRDGHVVYKTEAGIELESLDAVADVAASVCYLSGQPKGVEFLSDRTPASYRNLSDNALRWELGTDRDLYGAPLLQRDGFANKGLSLHSASQVAYRWDGSSAKFLAEVTLAPADSMGLQNLGSVNCQVLVARNGALALEQEFSLNRGRGSTPKYVDIDLAGAQLLVLVVEKSDFGSYADQVFWLDARVFKQP